MSGLTPFDVTTRKDIEKTFNELLAEARNIYEEAKKAGVKLLLYGSVAFYYKVKENKVAVELLKLYRKSEDIDINFLVRPEDRDKFKGLIAGLEYTPYFHLEKVLGDVAGMFFKENFIVKVYYFNEMRFNHVIPVNWDSDFTLDDEDLILSKLQRHSPVNKDLADVASLLLVKDVKDDKVLELTSADWGLWKDVTDNLVKLRQLISNLVADEIKEREEVMPVISKVVKLHGKVMNHPKKESWKPLPPDAKYWSDF